ncbi:MAG TPA: ACP phosphodiesterase [Thermoanaerobaculia bacterium]|nr:ACP phosphodiesterase [Thermoanaerobaculia bacterium]
MNYLAHLFLAGDDAESLIGNLAGDFVKGALHDAFTPGIREGIMQHRRIDAFTDTHPYVAAFRRVLIPDHGHYARIISDIFFDHFLAVDFERYAHEPLEIFVRRVFAAMHDQPKPGRLGRVFPHIPSWILSYRDIDGVRQALAGISTRLSRRPNLETAAHHLIDHRAELERRFHLFFPEVIAFARR